MPAYQPPRSRRSWMPWLKFGLALALVAGAGYGVLELGQRYLGLQKLTIEQVVVSGCRGERLQEVQAIADRLCLGKPLFWFDAGTLRQQIEDLRWIRGLLIRRDPPDRLAVVIEERKPLLWLLRPQGAFLLSDDGVVLDRVSQSNLAPIPVVADSSSQTDAALVELIRAATGLRDRQRDFYERVVEMRWTSQGPMVFLDGLDAPLRLSKSEPSRNIPNFQAVYLTDFSDPAARAKVRYFDLRWEGEVAVGLTEAETKDKGVKNP